MSGLRIAIAVCTTLVLAAASLPHALSAAPATKGEPLAVIVAVDSPVKDISHTLLRRIFMGERAEYAGTTFVPLNYPPSDPMRVAFDKAALAFSSDAAGRYWVDRRIRGQGLPPRAIPNAPLLRAVVARLPGAIGYIAVSQLSPQVRAVRIDGLSHHDPEYLPND